MTPRSEHGGSQAEAARSGRGGRQAEAARSERRGRQAEAARNDSLVLQAAREVFAAQGAGAPVSAVAERAGVGVGSLYRRYGSKDDLLRHLCTLAMRQTIDAAEDALARADAWEGLAGYIAEAVAMGTGALAPLAGAIETTPDMWDTSRRGRELLGRLVARAHKQGTLRRDATALDIAWLIELFGRLGPSAPGSEEDAIRQRLLAIALDGLRADGGQRDGRPADGAVRRALPGEPPTAAHYEGRWARPGRHAPASAPGPGAPQ